MSKYAIPLAIFVVLVIFLAIGLGHDPHEIPSPLINKPAPAFQLAQLQDPAKKFSAAEMHGKVWLLNVWATWCLPCREEHPLLVELSRSGAVPIYGMDYKDSRDDAVSLLSEQGNPYVLCVSDSDGRVAIDYGVYGVPETYLIDRGGVIRFKQVGPLTPESIEKNILPLVKELNK
ncbi:MAG: cytochrome c biosis protein CcmG, thiol:disulfide interchange protein DsbE [Blastocatellia bacterium]|jgi:cytochrome c biogenesis protein CcmG/thiol:disulfide interchange protein DsbE|nr:cytochrome c biosis protein CcmG, thiol:disulfide interchange protein DsbE [Blastocatellia bacterium]